MVYVIGLNHFSLFLVQTVLIQYMPLLFRGMGFMSAHIGFLLGAYSLSGVFGSIIISHIADATKRHKLNVVLAITVSLALFYVLSISSLFFLSLIVTVLLGMAFKPITPILDAISVNNLENPDRDYGKVRAAGTISFTFLSFFFAFTGIMNEAGPRSISIAFASPL